MSAPHGTLPTMTEDAPTPSLWYSPIEPCAFCKADLTQTPTFGDCNLRDGRGWGLVCPTCIEARSLRIGNGEGHLFQNRPGQKPICIAGER